MITLGDQQILTGIAILVSGYVRAAQNEQADQFPRWRYRLIENHFFLIVYLACLSSSSHLAAVITLKSYLNKNKVPAFMRLGLIVTFAILLTVTICLAVPFGPPTILFLTIDQDITWKERYCRDYVQASYGTDCSISADRFLLVLFYIVTTVAVLYPYWIAIINTFENWRAALKDHIKTFWRIDTRWLPMHWIRRSFDGMEKVGPRKFWKWLRRRLKSTFLFFVLGNTGRAFYLQLIFFAISLMYVIAQRVANTPREDVGMCDLSSGGTSWGFGQILPMLLLAFPVISAVVAYFGESPSLESPQQENFAANSSSAEVKKEVETCKSKDESSEDKVSNADDNV
ncbi:crispr-associated helicase cas3 [Neofusicoccum parvum]|nr:crispr-associated helicase cas3 [Neofusicoccum parvum]